MATIESDRTLVYRVSPATFYNNFGGFKMLLRRFTYVAQWLALVTGLGLTGCALDTPDTAQQPRNVILIIGDGMDDHQITIARNYLKGATGKLVVDQLPRRASVQVLTVAEDEPEQPLYVADSANSATAIATGVVTSRGRIATSAGDDRDLPTIVELAKAAGLRTGIVTTASITDATPASFIAHINARGCEGPSTMISGKSFGGWVTNCEQDLRQNGGQGSIAEQLAASDVDLLLGGGLKHFQQPLNSDSERNSLDIAREQGYQVITRKDQLSVVDSDSKLLGLFAPGTLPVSLRGENGNSAKTLADSRQQKAITPEPYSCEVNPAHETVPTLPAMTATALKSLGNSERGFFLMVESASIDKQSHMRRPCGSIGELQALDDSVQLALDYAQKYPNTLVLVTADHGQAAQLIPYPSLFDGMPGAHSLGHVAVLRTAEGSLMGVNYATNSAMIEEHTGTQVPLLANEQLPSDLGANIQQPELFAIMRDYLGLQSPQLSGN